MQPAIELHFDTHDPAARSRLSEALLAAARYAEHRRDDEPLRSRDTDTTRYAWTSLSAQLAIAAHRARNGTSATSTCRRAAPGPGLG